MNIVTAINDFRKKITDSFYERKTGMGRDGKYFMEIIHHYDNRFWVAAKYEIKNNCMKVCSALCLDWRIFNYCERLTTAIIEEAKEKNVKQITVMLELDNEIYDKMLEQFKNVGFITCENEECKAKYLKGFSASKQLLKSPVKTG